MDDKLTNAEQSNLTECEARIKHILTSFYETGGALQKIRDERLYRTTYATFEEYCQVRWDLTRRHVNQLIEAARVVENLSKLGTTVPNPSNERQARELAGLTPEEQRNVWQKAIETAPDGHITAAHIREAREALINSPEQETLFTLEDYRQAIDHHVSAANHHRSLADYHIRKAKHLRDEAFERFHVQIPLPFEVEEGQ